MSVYWQRVPMVAEVGVKWKCRVPSDKVIDYLFGSRDDMKYNMGIWALTNNRES